MIEFVDEALAEVELAALIMPVGLGRLGHRIDRERAG